MTFTTLVLLFAEGAVRWWLFFRWMSVAALVSELKMPMCGINLENTLAVESEKSSWLSITRRMNQRPS